MTDFLSRLEPPRLGWLVLGMLAMMIVWGTFDLVAFAHRGKEETRYRAMADSMEALMKNHQCVWLAPRDTVRRGTR